MTVGKPKQKPIWSEERANLTSKLDVCGQVRFGDNILFVDAPMRANTGRNA